MDDADWTEKTFTVTGGDAATIVGGLSDVRLSEKVVSTAAYTAFRTWVDDKGLSHTVVCSCLWSGNYEAHGRGF